MGWTGHLIVEIHKYLSVFIHEPPLLLKERNT